MIHAIKIFNLPKQFRIQNIFQFVFITFNDDQSVAELDIHIHIFHFSQLHQQAKRVN